MEEKTAELRDIFIDATGSETVTESQADTRGSLTDHDESSVKQRLNDLISTMRDRYSFRTRFHQAEYETIVRGYFDGADDATIATELSAEREETEPAVTESDVFRARLDLHLVGEPDRDAPFDFDDLKRLQLSETPIEERAARLDSDRETIARYSEIAEATIESTRANDRFHDEFRELLTDVDIEGTLAADAREDGLKEAAEDIETDVSF